MNRAGTWIAVTVVVLMLFALSARRIWTADYWWQWKTGEYVTQHGVPDSDVFSYTRAGHPRLELRWGYGLGLYAITRTFGHGSAVLLKCFAVLGMFAIVAGIERRRGDWIVIAAATALAALAASQRFFVRPEVLSYLFLAVFLAVVDRARHTATRWVYLLPLLSVLWVNVHGFFVFGPAVVGFWFGAELLARNDPDRRRRRTTAAALLAATLLASLVNPYFHRALLLPVIQLGALHGTSMKEFYTELHSPFAFESSFTALFYYKILIGVTLGSIALNPRRQSPFWLITIAAFFYLSTTAIRNLPLFCLAAIPFVARNVALSPLWSNARLARALPRVRPVAVLLLAVFCLFQSVQLYTNRFHVFQGDSNQFGFGLARHRFASDAVDFLQQTGATGPIFNTSATGSYLLARDYQVFIDPRGEIYLDGLIDEYREILDDPAALAAARQRYGFRIFFLESSMTGLIDRLRADPDWRLVYADEVAAILFHAETAQHVPEFRPAERDRAWLATIRESLAPARAFEERSRLAPIDSPQPYLRLGRLAFVLRAYATARSLLEDARAAWPPGFSGFELLAYAAAEVGDAAAAAGYYDLAVEESPGNAGLVLAAAKTHYQLGNLERVEALLDAGGGSSDPEALALRGITASRLGDPGAALGWLDRAIAVEPRNASYHLHRGRVLAALTRLDDARAALDEAARLAPRDERIRELRRRLAGP